MERNLGEANAELRQHLRRYAQACDVRGKVNEPNSFTAVPMTWSGAMAQHRPGPAPAACLDVCSPVLVNLFQLRHQPGAALPSLKRFRMLWHALVAQAGQSR